ncbi:MAG: transglutaminase family protein [Euryarchaeota archaeon]|nr:transglutaminase family protein [Euryarchaeota archaeon]
MTQVSEFAELANVQREPKRKPIIGTAFVLTKMILLHPKAFMAYRRMRPGEQRYVRPPREYEIPPFRNDMQYCNSKEKYLRPTRYCNPREHAVVAMANELGAYELSNYEFADAAYWFVKDNIHFEMCALDSAGTILRRGTGSCFHYINLFVALCRAAGIKARYKIFAINYDRARPQPVDPLWDGMYAAIGSLAAEAEAEVCIDGSWLVGHPAVSAELQAAKDVPVTKLGEDQIGVIFDAIPGTIKRSESIPLGFGWGAKMFFTLMPGSPERLSVNYLNAAARGRQIIEEVGGREAYDRKARMKWGLSTSVIGLKDDEALVFED